MEISGTTYKGNCCRIKPLEFLETASFFSFKGEMKI